MEKDLDESQITMFSKHGCKYCDWAHQFLTKQKLPFRSVEVDIGCPDYPKLRTHMIREHNLATFPWIFIGTMCLGGYSTLIHTFNTGRLKPMLMKINYPFPIQDVFEDDDF